MDEEEELKVSTPRTPLSDKYAFPSVWNLELEILSLDNKQVSKKNFIFSFTFFLKKL
jgi:hypothetical protein